MNQNQQHLMQSANAMALAGFAGMAGIVLLLINRRITAQV